MFQDSSCLWLGWIGHRQALHISFRPSRSVDFICFLFFPFFEIYSNFLLLLLILQFWQVICHQSPLFILRMFLYLCKLRVKMYLHFFYVNILLFVLIYEAYFPKRMSYFFLHTFLFKNNLTLNFFFCPNKMIYSHTNVDDMFQTTSFKGLSFLTFMPSQTPPHKFGMEFLFLTHYSTRVHHDQTIPLCCRRMDIICFS